MTCRYQIFLTFFLVLTLGTAMAEPAADPYASLNQLYVNQNHPNAADTPGNGSEANPWATIDYPINNNLLSAGDVLNIVNYADDGVELYRLTSSAGSVQEPTLRIRASGTATQPIVIRAKWGQYRKVRVEGPGQMFGNHSGGGNIQHFIHFAGLILHSTTPINGGGMNAYAGPFTFVGNGGNRAKGIHVEYCKLIGGGSAMYQLDNAQLIWMNMAGTTADPVVIRHNEFADHFSAAKAQHGGAGLRSYGGTIADVHNNLFVNVTSAYGYKSGAGPGSKFRRNIIKGTNTSVLDLNYAGGSGAHVDLEVSQNVWIGPMLGAATAENKPFIFLGDSGNIDRLHVFNNTLVDTSRIFYAAGSANVVTGAIEFFNNIRVRATGSAMDASEYVSGTMTDFVGYHDYNCLDNPGSWKVSSGAWSGYDSNSVSGNPRFLDPAGDDYGLQSSSPCKLAGVDRAQLLGGSAGAPINMGAYITSDNTDVIGPDWMVGFGADNLPNPRPVQSFSVQ